MMTPAVNALHKAKIKHQVHEYAHDPENEAYGAETVEKLGLPAERVFKTLVARIDTDELVVGIVPVSSMLSMKHLAKAVGAKKAAMANPADVERVTGYVLGGVSPLGQKRRLRTLIDLSALTFPTIYVSGGRRGLQIEISPQDLKKLTGAVFAEISAAS
jgi:Cys-tRNA(Pro)/Cys-tRNA(Cys) deacylase